MNRPVRRLPLLLLGGVTLLAGCTLPQAAPPPSPDPQPDAYMARYTDEAIDLDGRLQEAAWQEAPAYPFFLSSDAAGPVREGGRIRLLHTQTHLILGAELTDSDVVQESHEDQQPHFKSGDVLELFLKPHEAPHYWELYVTPNGKKTVYFFEGGGRKFLPSAYAQDPSWLDVAASVQGSFNDPSNRDAGWTAEMAVPLAELAARGIPLQPGQPWQILVGRYNYTIHLPARELSMSPQLPRTSFHETREWGELHLLPPGSAAIRD